MALSSTPTLTEINTELGTSGQKLSVCIANAGKSGVWDRQSDFALYSHGDSLSANPTVFNPSGVAQTLDVDVTSNTIWDVIESETWLSVSGWSGSGNDTFQINIDQNDGLDRTGYVTIEWSGTSVIITINQGEQQ